MHEVMRRRLVGDEVRPAGCAARSPARPRRRCRAARPKPASGRRRHRASTPAHRRASWLADRDSALQAHVDAALLAFDREHRRARHRRSERLRAAHAAEPCRQDPLVVEHAAVVLATRFGKRLVRALHDALAADVDPRAGRHLAEHHQALAIELVEVLPRRPMRDQVRIGDQHARRVRMRLNTPTGLPDWISSDSSSPSSSAPRRSRRSTPSCARRARCRRRRRARPDSPRPRDRGCSSACAAAPR